MMITKYHLSNGQYTAMVDDEDHPFTVAGADLLLDYTTSSPDQPSGPDIPDNPDIPDVEFNPVPAIMIGMIAIGALVLLLLLVKEKKENDN